VSLLRRVQHSRWYDAQSSLSEPLPADPLSDLGTSGNSLSVWQVLSNDSNLDDIVAGIAATLKYVTNIDVVLVDEEAISHLGIRVEPSQGRTPLAHARGYHRDLVSLRAQNLLEIAEIIRNHGVFQGFTERQVRELLARFIKERGLNPSDLQPDVRSHLEKKSLI
jgi:hypothetical protein